MWFYFRVCFDINVNVQKARKKLEEETARLTSLFECGGVMETHLEAALKKYRGMTSVLPMCKQNAVYA